MELKAERAETDPKIFTRIHMHFVLRGKKPENLDGGIRDQAFAPEILLGFDHARKTAQITHDYEIMAE